MTNDEMKRIAEDSQVAVMQITVYLLHSREFKGVTLEIPLDELRLKPENLTERYLIPAIKALKL